MSEVILSSHFKRDVKVLEKRGKQMDKLRALLNVLIAEDALPATYRDHALKGNWRGYRDAHIEPDWLLIYQIKGQDLLLARTGSHANIFG